MADYKDIVGTAVRNNAGNLSDDQTDQIFYDSTNIDFKYQFAAVTSAGTWATGNDLNTARRALGAAAGTSWQAVKTSTFTASAGEGYFVNTTSGVITMNLPAGTLGDEIAFIDYAGTFDSNTFTVSANGSEKIHGSTDDLTISTERAANTLVFTDSTQGWLLKNN